jgi:hypothetical protein
VGIATDRYVGVEVIGHRLDHLPGHLEFRRFDVDLLVQHREVGVPLA